jgi:ABC-2 type transport system permease protein
MKLFLLEWRLLFRERAVLVLLGLFALVIGYAIHAGFDLAEAQRKSHEASLAESLRFEQNLRDTLAKESLDVRKGMGRGHLALLPPPDFSLLSGGQADLLPSQERVILWNTDEPSEGRIEPTNPTRLLTGRFDLAFVLVWLFPLFLLALIHDLCAGDRESGTLRLALSRGIGAWKLLGVRVLARAAPMTVLALAGVMVAGALSAGGLSANVALALLVVLAYAAFWCAVALLTNCFARTAAAAATVVGSAWVVVVLVIPTLLNVAVESLHPMPSRARLVAVLREASGDAERRSVEVVDSFYREHPELAPPGMQADVLQRRLAVQERIGRAMEPIYKQFDIELANQQRVVERWRFASPAIAAYESLADLSGNGYWRHRTYRDQVAIFKGAVFRFYSTKFHRRQTLTAADIPNLPRFEFREVEPEVIRQRTLGALLGIFFLALMCLAPCVLRLSRRTSGELAN